MCLIVVLGIALATGCQRAPSLTKVRVALDWYPWANHAGLFLAQEKGYFREEGLEVEIYTPADPSTVLQTVGAGKDDFGISYQPDVLLARAQGVPVVSVAALVQHPLNSVMALRDSGIQRPRHLEGKKVGYPGIPLNVPLLKSMVEKDGGDFSKVELVNIGFDLVPALAGRRVDAIIGAYWVHESIVLEQQGFPVNILRVEQWGVPDFYELVLVTNEKTLAERPDLVKRFLRAVVKGYRDASQDLAGAVDTLAKASPQVDTKVEREGIRLLAPLWQDAPAFGWQTAERWTTFATWMQTTGLLERPVDASKAFTNRFIQELTRER
ncbi:MAG: ABC transporter substrate-binding protein [Chloroflexota bacterium]|nr:ABC transporter substrate-binding protein [Chloroflexota bacterium]